MKKQSRIRSVACVVVCSQGNTTCNPTGSTVSSNMRRHKKSIHVDVLVMLVPLILLLLNMTIVPFTHSFTLDNNRQWHTICRFPTTQRWHPQQQPYTNRMVSFCTLDTTTTTTTTSTNGRIDDVDDVDVSSKKDDDTPDNNVRRYKEEAAKIRLEAEKMDLELVITKIQTIQNSIQKLVKKQQQQQQQDHGSNNSTSTRNDATTSSSSSTSTSTSSNQIRESTERLEEQIRALQKKIHGNTDDTVVVAAAATINSVHSNTGSIDDGNTPTSISTTSRNAGTFVATATTAATTTTTTTTITKPSSRINIVPTTASRTATAVQRQSVSTVSPSTTEMAATKQSAVMERPPKKQQSYNWEFNAEANSDTIYGFDKADLDLYLPVAMEIEATMSNATADERLEQFRTSPMLQTNFQTKLSQLLVEPMEDMNRIEELKQQYLDSTSSREKELIKRQIDTITNSLETDGPFVYSDSVYRPIRELTIDEMNERVAAISTLPNVLQTIYKQRFNLNSTDDISLAILLDHYEVQLQLIEQIKLLSQPFTTDIRRDIVQAIESLPLIVRNHVATVVGLDAEHYSMDDLIVELTKDDDSNDNRDDADSNWWNQIVGATSIRSTSNKFDVASPSSSSSSLTGMDWSVLGDFSTLGDDDGNDIEMIDRSRYVYDFYPAIARMEQDDVILSYEQVDQISRALFDPKKTFMVTNKLERVVGGYYIRGRNLLDEDGSGHKLMAHVQNILHTTSKNTTLDYSSEAFEYFYVRDPAPLTDEEIELEYRNDPVFIITRKNVTRFYNNATPLMKAVVTLAAFASMGLLAIDSFHLEQSVLGQLESSIGLSAVATNEIAISSLLSNLGQIVLPLVIVQLAHDVGHRFVAWKDKFNVGIPTLVPFMQLGCVGTITPLTSPPPNLKSMFDFGMSGPLVGLLSSLVLLASGLQLTSVMDLKQLALLPSLPTDILRSSTLGGAFIELFLGSGCLLPEIASLSIHPFAIAGYIGMISNALALLPLGNTDGGRIAISMFGRRGILLVKTLVTAMLCSAGIFGLDDSGILLNYIIIVILWQNEIETPARNEVEELDFSRGCFGIVMAAVVFTILLPMQS